MTPRFPLGQVVATPGALEALERAGQSPDFFLQKHVSGHDWGDVDTADQKANDEALREGGRLVSAYFTLKGEKLWVITESDRSSTTLLLPDEY
jgi:hypothetical protein